jgi:hypothetical protein
MEVDPLASMRCWAVDIELGGRVFEIPALPAVDWWPVVSEMDLGLILDFITSSPDDPHNVDDLLLSGAFTAQELTTTLTEAFEEVAGRSLHVAFVLATVAKTGWSTINGTLATAGFRWDEQPLGAALDALYAAIVERLDKEALDKFLALLDNETLTSGKPTKRHRKKVLDEFETMAGPKPTSGAVATGGPSGSGRPRTRPRLQPRRPAARSASPRQPRGPRAGSGPAASSVGPGDADGPTSGTGPPPPP